MVSGVALSKSLKGWEFISEVALEKFVVENIQQLLSIDLLEQQYSSSGEICDILAVDHSQRLIIIEIKNVADRCLIQQLTRYYANLLKEKPFSSKINYTHPIRLIAIAPSYHRHNLIDSQYSTLDFELIQFSIVEENNKLWLVLQDIELKLIKKFLIPYETVDIPKVESVPEPPESLLAWLGSCSSQEQLAFLNLRNKVISCSPKMKEVVNKNTIQYGSGKTKLCAEICFKRKIQKPILFLWLPTPSTYNPDIFKSDSKETTKRKKPIIGRLRIWTDGQMISHIGHVPKGFGKMRPRSEWGQLPPNKRPRGLRESLSSKSHTPLKIEGYLRFPKDEEGLNYWEFLSDLAIEIWLSKISGR